MKPPERAPPSKAAKQGSVLPVSMRGTLLPSNSCTSTCESVQGHAAWCVCLCSHAGVHRHAASRLTGAAWSAALAIPSESGKAAAEPCTQGTQLCMGCWAGQVMASRMSSTPPLSAPAHPRPHVLHMHVKGGMPVGPAGRRSGRS